MTHSTETLLAAVMLAGVGLAYLVWPRVRGRLPERVRSTLEFLAVGIFAYLTAFGAAEYWFGAGPWYVFVLATGLLTGLLALLAYMAIGLDPEAGETAERTA